MGNVQKVFYFHVAAGWVGMLGFLVAAGAGIFYLAKGDRKWDIIGLSAVEIGMAFAFINIVTGSIWARPIWNTWWTWDPRLTTATIMELIYAAYLMLRAGIEDPNHQAAFWRSLCYHRFCQCTIDILLCPPVSYNSSGRDRLKPTWGGRAV